MEKGIKHIDWNAGDQNLISFVYKRSKNNHKLLTYFILGVMVDDLRILDLTTKKQEKPFAITNEISIVKWNPKKVSY